MGGEAMNDADRLAYRRRVEFTETYCDVRCPECYLNWALFPPAKITDKPLVRCVECKSVYPEIGEETYDRQTDD